MHWDQIYTRESVEQYFKKWARPGGRDNLCLYWYGPYAGGQPRVTLTHKSQHWHITAAKIAWWLHHGHMPTGRLSPCVDSRCVLVEHLSLSRRKTRATFAYNFRHRGVDDDLKKGCFLDKIESSLIESTDGCIRWFGEYWYGRPVWCRLPVLHILWRVIYDAWPTGQLAPKCRTINCVNPDHYVELDG